jgi:hypothetical protein
VGSNALDGGNVVVLGGGVRGGEGERADRTRREEREDEEACRRIWEERDELSLFLSHRAPPYAVLSDSHHTLPCPATTPGAHCIHSSRFR